VAITYSASKCRVLIVDDDADTVQSTALLFEMQGHATRTAVNGIEALAQGAAFRPHLMLLDIAMPQMDGFAVAAAVRATDWGKHCVLVAVTGYGTPATEDRCAISGFDHYLIKPVDYGEFTAMMSQTAATFFELKRESARTRREQVTALTTFVRLELELARRFLDTSVLVRDPLAKERNRNNARNAYDEAEKWVKKDAGMTVEDRSEIAADLARLKPALYQPNDCPFNAVPLEKSLMAFGVPLSGSEAAGCSGVGLLAEPSFGGGN
jgi:CheY-like chemotaxis protein